MYWFISQVFCHIDLFLNFMIYPVVILYGSNDKKLSLLPYSYCHPFLLLCLKVTPLFPSTKKAGYLPTFAKTSLYMDFFAMHTVPNIVSIPSIFARRVRYACLWHQLFRGVRKRDGRFPTAGFWAGATGLLSDATSGGCRPSDNDRRPIL